PLPPRGAREVHHKAVRPVPHRGTPPKRRKRSLLPRAPVSAGIPGGLGIRTDRGEEPRPPRAVPERGEGRGLGRPRAAAWAARRGKGVDRPEHPRTGGAHGSLRGGVYPDDPPRPPGGGTVRAREGGVHRGGERPPGEAG